jgi:hypothetical protein
MDIIHSWAYNMSQAVNLGVIRAEPTPFHLKTKFLTVKKYPGCSLSLSTLSGFSQGFEISKDLGQLFIDFPFNLQFCFQIFL